MESAFDNDDHYELTALSQQFIHYVMTELTPKISYQPPTDEAGDEAKSQQSGESSSIEVPPGKSRE